VPGDRVNVETDILARHVARLAEFGALQPVDLVSRTERSQS
jgi:riboflavin synthase alpha subunit